MGLGSLITDENYRALHKADQAGVLLESDFGLETNTFGRYNLIFNVNLYSSAAEEITTYLRGQNQIRDSIKIPTEGDFKIRALAMSSLVGGDIEKLEGALPKPGGPLKTIGIYKACVSKLTGAKITDDDLEDNLSDIQLQTILNNVDNKALPQVIKYTALIFNAKYPKMVDSILNDSNYGAVFRQILDDTSIATDLKLVQMQKLDKLLKISSIKYSMADVKALLQEFLKKYTEFEKGK